MYHTKIKNVFSFKHIMANDKHCLLKNYVVSLGKLIKCAPRSNPAYFIFVFLCEYIRFSSRMPYNVCAKYLICFLLISVYHCKMVMRFNKWIDLNWSYYTGKILSMNKFSPRSCFNDVFFWGGGGVGGDVYFLTL